MKFWQFSVTALATLLAAVQAGGPADGSAIADPNSAVVQLTSADFEKFVKENPLVLAEFFAPWCGYCKMLAPEFSKAADSLAQSHPNIKLAQLDCDNDQEFCQGLGVKGYPTLKVFQSGSVSDYEGPRSAEGIADYVIDLTLPSVSEPSTLEEYTSWFTEQEKPFLVQILPESFKDATFNTTFSEIANAKRKEIKSLSISAKNIVADLAKSIGVKLLQKVPQYFLIRPSDLTDATEFIEELTPESLTKFIETELLPYFGEINQNTYQAYMNSVLPIAYYFYKTQEERAAAEPAFNKLGKKYRGKINFVSLDAVQFGRHAEVLNMDPDVVPFFSIQELWDNKKYGINQTEYPEGPSDDVIAQFVADYFDEKLTPIIKSEELPTEEEIASQSVRKLVTHNHDEIIYDEDKDVFVKYYAPWCGHCKTLAPKWEELASIYGSNQPDAEVIIADIDHTANDVATPFTIEGYPTLVLYPANGEIDPATGKKKFISFDGQREVESLIEFLQKNGGKKVDIEELKLAKANREAEAAATAGDAPVEAAKENAHDEL